MKKTIKLALFVCLALLACVPVFTACDGGHNPQIPGGTGDITTTVEETTTIEETTEHTCSFGEWTTLKDATCTDNGQQERTCECGEKETQSIDALGHSEVIDEAVAPTCTKTGLTEGKHCSACETVLVSQETVPASHEWDTEYGWNKDTHWLNCIECDEINDKVAHTLGADGYCEVCNNPLVGTDGVMYIVSANGKYAEVVDYTGTSLRVNIAAEYNGVPVTRIADGAFRDVSLTHLIIPDSITTIGSYVFEDSNIENISIPDSVTMIFSNAFADCRGLKYNEYDNAYYLGNESNPYVVLVGARTTSITSCTIHSATKYIYSGAFYNCSNLTSITIPDGVTVIDDQVFEECTGLTSITIPDSVTSMGISTFSGCIRLESITIPDSITCMGSFVLKDCTSLESINFGGTKEQWNAVSKIGGWDYSTGSYIIYCTDGTISKSE